MFRKCCGYYCAMIAAVALFFYGVILVREIRKNQFVMWKMQYPPEGHGIVGPEDKPVNQTNWNYNNLLMEEKANGKILPIIIVLVVRSFSLIIIAKCFVHIRLLVLGQPPRKEGGCHRTRNGEG